MAALGRAFGMIALTVAVFSYPGHRVCFGEAVADKKASVMVSKAGDDAEKRLRELEHALELATLRMAELQAELDGCRLRHGQLDGGRVEKDRAESSGSMTVLDVNPELGMLVASAGLGAGLKPGISLSAVREDRVTGVVKVYDVREHVSGCVLERQVDRNSIRPGDRLVIGKPEKQ